MPKSDVMEGSGYGFRNSCTVFLCMSVGDKASLNALLSCLLFVLVACTVCLFVFVVCDVCLFGFVVCNVCCLCLLLFVMSVVRACCLSCLLPVLVCCACLLPSREFNQLQSLITS